MGTKANATSATEAIAVLDAGIDCLAELDPASLCGAELLDTIEAVERRRRRLDDLTDRLVGEVDSSGACGIDGHRSAKAAVRARCGVSGAEAHARIRSARVLRSLPHVAGARARGDASTESIRAIARTLSNPRVSEFGPLVDEVFADQATSQTPEQFQSWLRDWERLADADGAEQRAEGIHARRNASLIESAIDSSWSLQGRFGALPGAAMSETLAEFEDAEFRKDWLAARAVHGDETRVEHLARTAAQRRADAIFEIFRRARAVPADAQAPEPLVNIVVDRDTFERELCRVAGAEPRRPDVTRSDVSRCQTDGGTRCTPSEAFAAALVGHVRRVVVDSSSTVIDLGRKRRLFTGRARDAALLQGVLRNREGLRCAWHGCGARPHRLQVDHRTAWSAGGPTDTRNSRPLCLGHNLLAHQLDGRIRGPDA